MDGKSAKDYEADWTEPELRARLEEEIKAGEHVPNTDVAEQARKAAELIDVPAPEARERVAAMDDDARLDRARRAEEDLGGGRTTVLWAIEADRHRDVSACSLRRASARATTG